VSGAHDIRSLIRTATESGFTVERTRKNHIKFTSPSGKVFFTGGTPGDRRAIFNVRSLMRKAGLHDR
jgi:hypothetical protein